MIILPILGKNKSLIAIIPEIILIKFEHLRYKAYYNILLLQNPINCRPPNECNQRVYYQWNDNNNSQVFGHICDEFD